MQIRPTGDGVLSIDVPSGLDFQTGKALSDLEGGCIQAEWTFNLHALKIGQIHAALDQVYIKGLWSGETGLGYFTHPAPTQKQLEEFYAEEPIRKVAL